MVEKIRLIMNYNTNNIMTRQLLLERYNNIEVERKKLKENWVFLKENRGDKDEIRRIGTQLTKLTLNQAHIIIGLTWVK